MDDEHEDDDGIDAARSGCRNEDTVTGRVEYRSPIQVKSATELQMAAWNRVGRTLRESMEREKASSR